MKKMCVLLMVFLSLVCLKAKASTDYSDRVIMWVGAHPDDEMYGAGNVFTKYCVDGNAKGVFVIMQSQRVDDKDVFAKEFCNMLRKREGRRAANGFNADLRYLDVSPGQSHQDIHEATKRLVRIIREIKPDVIITHGDEGDYGHQMHIETSMMVTNAFWIAGMDSCFPEQIEEGLSEWQTPRLYKYLSYYIAKKNSISMGPDGNDSDYYEYSPRLVGADQNDPNIYACNDPAFFARWNSTRADVPTINEKVSNTLFSSYGGKYGAFSVESGQTYFDYTKDVLLRSHYSYGIHNDIYHSFNQHIYLRSVPYHGYSGYMGDQNNIEYYGPGSSNDLFAGIEVRDPNRPTKMTNWFVSKPYPGQNLESDGNGYIENSLTPLSCLSAGWNQRHKIYSGNGGYIPIYDYVGNTINDDLNGNSREIKKPDGSNAYPPCGCQNDSVCDCDDNLMRYDLTNAIVYATQNIYVNSSSPVETKLYINCRNAYKLFINGNAEAVYTQDAYRTENYDSGYGYDYGYDYEDTITVYLEGGYNTILMKIKAEPDSQVIVKNVANRITKPCGFSMRIADNHFSWLPYDTLYYWNMETDSNGAVIDVYNGVAGALSNGAEIVETLDEISGNHLQLDDITNMNERVEIPLDINPADGPFSIFAWVKGGNLEGSTIICQEDSSGVGKNWLQVSGGVLSSELSDGSSDIIEAYNIWDSNIWHHVGFVWNGSIRKLYCDGECVASDQISIGNLESSDGNLIIGDHQSVTTIPWIGCIDDILLCKYSMSDEQVRNIILEHGKILNFENGYIVNADEIISDSAHDNYLDFSDPNASVEMPFILNPADGPFSAFAWVKGGGYNQKILCQGDDTGRAWLQVDPYGKFNTVLQSDTSGLLNTDISWDPNSWHHVGIVWDSNQTRHLYYDGIEVACDNSSIGELVSSNGSLYIGAHKSLPENPGDLFYDCYWNGNIDDVFVCKYVLTVEQVHKMFVEKGAIAHWKFDGNGNDYSGNGNDVSVISGPYFDSDSLVFDGVDDYVLTPFILDPGAGPFSAMAWVRGGDDNQKIICQGDDGRAWLQCDPYGYFNTVLQSGTSGLLNTDVAWDSNNWHHVCFVWDGQKRHLFYDGIEVAEDVAEIDNLTPSAGPLYIGAHKLRTSYFWTGDIDDVRIYPIALTGSEVQLAAEQY